MAGFTIKNLLEDVPDSAAERMPGIEARFSRSHIDSEHIGLTYMRFDAGIRSPMAHSHREQEEVYLVAAGNSQARLDDEVLSLKTWDVVRVAPETVRAFEAGNEGMLLIAIGSDRPEGGDGVLDESPWPD